MRCQKYNRSAETEKIGAETAKIQSAEKSAETGGNSYIQLTIYKIFYQFMNEINLLAT